MVNQNYLDQLFMKKVKIKINKKMITIYYKKKNYKQVQNLLMIKILMINILRI